MNKKMSLLWCGLFFCQFAFSNLKINFKHSKIHALYNFVETISGYDHRNRAIKELFDKSQFNSPETQKLIQEFQELGPALNNYIVYPGNLNTRYAGIQIGQLMLIRSVVAKDLDDLAERTLELMPIASHAQLFNLLEQFLIIYEKLIWDDNFVELTKYTGQLMALAEKVDLELLYNKAAAFYGATWPKNQAFYVSFWPIPLKKGSSNAESLGTIESMGILFNANDDEGKFGVLFHELSHSLYKAQSFKLKQEIENFFMEHPSPYSKIAYRFFNEALATTLGNGIAFEEAAGHLDQGSWYNNRYIHGFGKALYPETKKYFLQSKTMDQHFFEMAVSAFAAIFPDSIYEYAPRFQEVLMMGDDVVFQISTIRGLLRKYFRTSSSWGSSPIADEQTLETFQRIDQTALIVVSGGELNQLDGLAQIYSPLAERLDLIKSEPDSYIYSFIDKNNRAVIILKVENELELENALSLLKEKERIDSRNPWIKL